MEKKKKVDSLSSVEDPLKVKVLILAQQKTSFQDFFFINAFTNVVKIDLSYNKLTSFPSGFSFTKFPKLKILFLHYNKFSNHKNLSSISNSSTLEYLTLFGNPIEETKTRHFFVNKIGSLKLMDDKIVKIEERFPQLLLQQPNPISLKVPFPLVPAQSSQLSSSFLSVVIEQLRIIRKKYMQANPLIKIQRWFKKMLKKKQAIKRLYLKRSESEKIEKIVEKRLITEKYENSKKNEQKIISVLKTNFQFLKVLQTFCHSTIYALRSFCEANSIGYEKIPQFYCIRNENKYTSKKFIQFLLQNNRNYVVRKKGSNIAMNFSKKYVLLRKIKMEKKKATATEPNKAVSLKLEEKRKSYEDVFVQISPSQLLTIFPLVKQSYFNSLKSNQKFPFIFSSFWNRNIAAVSIQRMWRGYKVRRKLNMPDLLLKKAAAIRIQRWIRKLAFRNRQNFMLQSYFYIKEETSNFLVIPNEDLLKLEDVVNRNKSAINFVFPEQKILSFTYKSEGKNVCLGTTARVHPPHFQQYLSFTKYSDQETQQKNPAFVLYTLLFKGAVQVSSFERQGRYTKLEYCSQLQTRNRKYLLALATYCFGSKNFLKSSEFEIGNKGYIVDERIQKEIFIGYELPKKLENRFDKQFKIRYFQNKEDLTKSIKMAFPVGFTLAQSPNKILNSERSLFRERSNYSSAKISKNILSLQNNFDSIKKSKRYNDFSSITVKGTEGFEKDPIHENNRTENVRTKVYETDEFGSYEKKEKVELIRNSHREKVEANKVLKKEELKKIRKEINEEEKKQEIQIKMNKIQNLMTNIRKHNFIKSKLSPRNQEFEKEFLTRGNSSIKKEMIRHERISKSPDNSSILSGSNSSKNHLITKPSKRYVNLKTDIKQFSMNISETDLSLGNIPLQEQEKEVKQIKKEVVDEKRETRNIQFNSVETFEVMKKSKEERKKKDRKKKIVHSVFPEEFYPLKQSKKLGFELPKIKR